MHSTYNTQRLEIKVRQKGDPQGISKNDIRPIDPAPPQSSLEKCKRRSNFSEPVGAKMMETLVYKVYLRQKRLWCYLAKY